MSLSSVSRTTDPTRALSLPPEVTGANSALTVATNLLPGDYTSPLLQHMSISSSMGDPYASPPHQLARSSASPDSTHVEHQLVAAMNALQNQDGDCQSAYATSPWSGCFESQTSSDEFEHYALQSSPAVSSLQPTSSGRSSPRSWDSPEQLGPTPWEAATEQLQSRYHGLDPQLFGYQLRDGAGYDIPTSFPAGASFLQTQSFNGQEDCQRGRSQTEPYPAGSHTSPREGYLANLATPESGHPVSPCNTSLRLSVEDGGPSSPEDDVTSQAETLVGPEDPAARSRKKSPGVAHTQTDGPKHETPYAQLIYRAFLSTPRRAMTLQEIYQWFRENTDKGKDDSKGWQNSIRHNLSMNQAFTKRERKASNTKDGDATSSSSQTDGKKSTEWYLEPWAVAGVQSTTRYRKGNQSRRSAASHSGLSSRVYRSYPARHHHHPSFSKKGQVHGGRVLRGTRQLRSTSTPMHHHPPQPYPFPPHHTPYTSHGIHHLINCTAPLSTSRSPYAAPPASFFPHHHHSPAAAMPGIDYDYPDPQLFPSSSSSSGSMARSTSSEPGTAGDNEPVTPEPLQATPAAGPYGGHAVPQTLLDSQGQYYTTGTGTGSEEATHDLPMAGYQAHNHGAYLHHQTAVPTVVGVYDESMEAAVEGFQGWGAASIAGLGGVQAAAHGLPLPGVDQDGMGVCGEQNHGYHHHAGY